MIKAIAFDYRGVVEISDGDLIEEIVEYLKITKEKWKTIYNKYISFANSGEKSWEDVVILTALSLNASQNQLSDIKKMITRHENKKFLNSEIINLIISLKKKNFKIGLISNFTSNLRQRLSDQKIINLFDAIIISGEVGYRKPEPEIFHKLFESLGVKSNELVFIDDSQKSLTNAKEVGYYPLLFLNTKQINKDLKLIIKNEKF